MSDLNQVKGVILSDLLNEFNKMTLALAKDGELIKQEITPQQANLSVKMGILYVKSEK